LIEELNDVDKKLTEIMDDKEKQKKKAFARAPKPPTKTRQ
jgi:hypothetical protein